MIGAVKVNPKRKQAIAALRVLASSFIGQRGTASLLMTWIEGA